MSEKIEVTKEYLENILKTLEEARTHSITYDFRDEINRQVNYHEPKAVVVFG